MNKEKIQERKIAREARLENARKEMAANKAKRDAKFAEIKEKNAAFKEGIRQRKFERNLNKLNNTLDRALKAAKEAYEYDEKMEKQRLAKAAEEVEPEDVIIEIYDGEDK